MIQAFRSGLAYHLSLWTAFKQMSMFVYTAFCSTGTTKLIKAF